jgi:methyl-accepting chemotaxis protein
VRVTVASRLLGLVLTGTAAVALVSGISVAASRSQASHARDMADFSRAMSSQWNADMMHDALRADVMAAFVATDASQREGYGANEVGGHAEDMAKRLAEAEAGAPASLRPEYEEARGEVKAYGELAIQIVQAANRDPVRARSSLPRFMEAFSSLEERMGRIDELLSVAVDAQAESTARAGGTATRRIAVTAALGALALVLLSVLIVRSVVRPIRHIRAQLAKVAAGDLTVVTGTGRCDELGDLADSVDLTIATVRDGFSVMSDCADGLTTQSHGLRTASTELTAAAQETSDRAGRSVSLAERVAVGAGEVSDGIGTVSAQTHEISGSAETAAAVGRRAMDGAHIAAESITRLGDSSAQISGVASMIRAISDQTRLLALNATIEAARAGDAGRGFAVVASEVKELAQEVGRATEDISGRIGAIQAEVLDAVRSIEAVTTVIAEINAHQADIAEAVTSQSRTSAEVASKIDVASEAASGIARTVASISAAAEQTTTTAQLTLAAAGDLGEAADQMRSILGRFEF